MYNDDISSPQTEQEKPQFGVGEFVGSTCAAVATLGGAVIAQLEQRKWLKKIEFFEKEFIAENTSYLMHVKPFFMEARVIQEKIALGIPVSEHIGWFLQNAAYGEVRINNMESIQKEWQEVQQKAENYIDLKIVWGGIALAAGAACLTGYVMMQQHKEEPNQNVSAVLSQQKIVTQSSTAMKNA